MPMRISVAAGERDATVARATFASALLVAVDVVGEAVAVAAGAVVAVAGAPARSHPCPTTDNASRASSVRRGNRRAGR
jgi:hypothetical protein